MTLVPGADEEILTRDLPRRPFSPRWPYLPCEPRDFVALWAVACLFTVPLSALVVSLAAAAAGSAVRGIDTDVAWYAGAALGGLTGAFLAAFHVQALLIRRAHVRRAARLRGLRVRSGLAPPAPRVPRGLGVPSAVRTITVGGGAFVMGAASLQVVLVWCAVALGSAAALAALRIAVLPLGILGGTAATWFLVRTRQLVVE